MTIQEFVQYVKSLEISTQAPSLGICKCYPEPTVDPTGQTSETMIKHREGFCYTCDCYMIICGTCGNNCCNGGYGQVNGKQCPDCPSAYELQKRREKNKWVSPV